jgi:hypothetical protein
MDARDQDHANRASLGGKARTASLSPDERKALARAAARERWRKAKSQNAGILVPGENASLKTVESTEVSETKSLPSARWPGMLTIGNVEIPVYVLSDGRRVVSRTGATLVLIGSQGGGNIESYLRVKAVEPFIPANLSERMIDFEMRGVVNKSVMGMDAETFLEICGGYVKAWQEKALESDVQIGIAMRAAMFLAACSKVGLIALIDEATGYQYQRAEDELQIKLKMFLLDEMRKWEKTFPVELWEQFGKLTNWKGGVNQRPKYWGKLVMDLIYNYLDADVAQWLRENAPKPRHGQNYHQWLTEQYGLRKLVEHIWKVIGIASTCTDMTELKTRMEELYGKRPGFQFQFRLVPGSPVS